MKAYIKTALRRRLCLEYSYFDRMPFFCTLAQTQYGICNSTAYALNYLRHSLDDLPLLFLVQLADRTFIIAKGLFLSASSP